MVLTYGAYFARPFAFRWVMSTDIMEGGKSTADLFRTKLRGFQWCGGAVDDDNNDDIDLGSSEDTVATIPMLEDAPIERKCNVLRGRVVPLETSSNSSSSSTTSGGEEGSSGNNKHGRASSPSAFIQMSMPLSNVLPEDFAVEGAATVDASEWAGIVATVFCPRSEEYTMLLRTPACQAASIGPRSGYRATFSTEALQFIEVRLPWSAFEPPGGGGDLLGDELAEKSESGPKGEHEEREASEGLKSEASGSLLCRAPLDPTQLRRIGFLAWGRAYDPELAVAEVRFYKEDEDDTCAVVS